MAQKPEGFLAEGLKAVGIIARGSNERRLLQDVCAEVKEQKHIKKMDEAMGYLLARAATKARRALALHRMDQLPTERVLRVLSDLPQDLVQAGGAGDQVVKGFVSAELPGSSLGKGSDAMLVKILGGDFTQAGVRGESATIFQKTGDEASEASKRWLICNLTGDQFKVAELEVTSSDEKYFVAVLLSKFANGYAKKKWSGDVQAEALLILDDPKATVNTPALSDSDAGFGVTNLKYRKPPQAPTRGDVPKILRNYPSNQLEFLLEVIDYHSGHSRPRSVQHPLEVVELTRPETTPYVPEKRNLKVTDYMGVIILEDAGETSVNGKYMKTKRFIGDRSIYQHEGNPDLKIQWHTAGDCWVVEDTTGLLLYKIVHDVHMNRCCTTNFPYEGVWEVYQDGSYPVPFTKKTCFHYRSVCRDWKETARPEEKEMAVYAKIPRRVTHPTEALEVQRKWPTGGGWNPPHLASTQRSLLNTGVQLTQWAPTYSTQHGNKTTGGGQLHLCPEGKPAPTHYRAKSPGQYGPSGHPSHTLLLRAQSAGSTGSLGLANTYGAMVRAQSAGTVGGSSYGGLPRAQTAGSMGSMGAGSVATLLPSQLYLSKSGVPSGAVKRLGHRQVGR